MKSNPSVKLPMRNVTPTSNNAPTIANTYRPSVPISVYRELAAELQTAETMLESLNHQNQQLIQQNQQLRQEIEKVVQSHQHLQQIIAASTPLTPSQAPLVKAEIRSQQPSRSAVMVRSSKIPVVSPPVTLPSSPPSVHLSEPTVVHFAEKEPLVTEQEEARYGRPAPPERNSEVNGWFLAMAIFLIVATAFGTGFLIVRPLLKNSR